MAVSAFVTDESITSGSQLTVSSLAESYMLRPDTLRRRHATVASALLKNNNSADSTESSPVAKMMVNGCNNSNTMMTGVNSSLEPVHEGITNVAVHLLQLQSSPHSSINGKRSNHHQCNKRHRHHHHHKIAGFTSHTTRHRCHHHRTRPRSCSNNADNEDDEEQTTTTTMTPTPLLRPPSSPPSLQAPPQQQTGSGFRRPGSAIPSAKINDNTSAGRVSGLISLINGRNSQQKQQSLSPAVDLLPSGGAAGDSNKNGACDHQIICLDHATAVRGVNNNNENANNIKSSTSQQQITISTNVDNAPHPPPASRQLNNKDTITDNNKDNLVSCSISQIPAVNSGNLTSVVKQASISGFGTGESDNINNKSIEALNVNIQNGDHHPHQANHRSTPWRTGSEENNNNNFVTTNPQPQPAPISSFFEHQAGGDLFSGGTPRFNVNPTTSNTTTSNGGLSSSNNNNTNDLVNSNSNLPGSSITDQQQQPFPSGFYWPGAAFLAAAAAAAITQQQQRGADQQPVPISAGGTFNSSTGNETASNFPLWYSSPFFLPYPPQSGWPANSVPNLPNSVPPPPVQFQDPQQPASTKSASNKIGIKGKQLTPSPRSTKMGAGTSVGKLVSTTPIPCISTDSARLLQPTSSPSSVRKREPSPICNRSPSRQQQQQQQPGLRSKSAAGISHSSNSAKPPIPPKPNRALLNVKNAMLGQAGHPIGNHHHHATGSRPSSPAAKSSSSAGGVNNQHQGVKKPHTADAIVQTFSPAPGATASPPSGAPSTSTVTLGGNQADRNCAALMDDNWTIAEPTPPGSESGGDIFPMSSSYCSQFVWEPRNHPNCTVEHGADLLSCMPPSNNKRRQVKPGEDADLDGVEIITTEGQDANRHQRSGSSRSPTRKQSHVAGVRQHEPTRPSSKIGKSKTPPCLSPVQKINVKSEEESSTVVRQSSPKPFPPAQQSPKCVAATSAVVSGHAIKISIDGITPPPNRKKYADKNIGTASVAVKRRGPGSLDDPSERPLQKPDRIGKEDENDGIPVLTSRSANAAFPGHRGASVEDTMGPLLTRSGSGRRSELSPLSSSHHHHHHHKGGRSGNNSKYNTIDRTFFRTREEYEEFASAVKTAAAAMSTIRRQKKFPVNEQEQQVIRASTMSEQGKHLSQTGANRQATASPSKMSKSYDETTTNSTIVATGQAAAANGAYNVALQTASSTTSSHHHHHHQHGGSTRRHRGSIRSEIVDVDAFDTVSAAAVSDSEQYRQNGQPEDFYINNDNHSNNTDDKDCGIFMRDGQNDLANGNGGSVYVDASSDQGGPGGSGTDDTANLSKQGSFVNSQSRYKKKSDSTAIRGSSRLNRYATARERRLSIGASASALGAAPNNCDGIDSINGNGEFLLNNGGKHVRKSILANGQNKLAIMSKQMQQQGDNGTEIGQLVSMFGNEIPCAEHFGPNGADGTGAGALLTATAKTIGGTNSASSPPASAYCTVCYSALCRQCAQKAQHAQHTIVSLEMGAKRRMHEMQSTCREIDERAKNFEETLHMLVKENKELKRHRAGVKSQIQATCNRLVNAITLRTEQLIQELDELYNAAEGEYIRQRDDVDRALLVLRGTKKFAQNLLLNLDNAHYRSLLLSSKVEVELHRLVSERRPTNSNNGQLIINPDGSNFWFEENPRPVIRPVDVNELSTANCQDFIDIGHLVVANNANNNATIIANNTNSNTSQPPPPVPPVVVSSHNNSQPLPQIIPCSTKDQTPPTSSSSSNGGGPASTASVVMNNHQLAQLAKIIAPPPANDYARIDLLFDFHCHVDTDRSPPMPECLACGPQGQILISDSVNRKIKVYREDGNFQMEIQCRSQPYGIAVLGNDKFAITLYDEVSQKATVEFYELSSGNYLRALAYTSECKNRRMAIAPTDRGFVLTDSDCNQLRLYDASGQLLSSFDIHAIVSTGRNSSSAANCNNCTNGKQQVGSSSSCYAHHVLYIGDGQTSKQNRTPSGTTLAVPPAESLLVASLLDSNQVCGVGALSGKLVFRYGSQGVGREQLSSPCGLTVDPRGNLIVADSGNSRLHVLSQAGNLLCHLPLPSPSSSSSSAINKQQAPSTQQQRQQAPVIRHPKAVAMINNNSNLSRLVVAERSGHIKVFAYNVMPPYSAGHR